MKTILITITAALALAGCKKDPVCLTCQTHVSYSARVPFPEYDSIFTGCDDVLDEWNGKKQVFVHGGPWNTYTETRITNCR